jgi:hypothetical protein
MHGYGIIPTASPPKRTSTIRRTSPALEFQAPPPVKQRTITRPSAVDELSLLPGTLATGGGGGFDLSTSSYLPPSFTPSGSSTRSFPVPTRSPFTPSGSSTAPTFDPTRRITTPSFPTPRVSAVPSYPTPGGRGGPRRSFWDLFRPAPPRPVYPAYPPQSPYYMPLVPGGELYAAGVFGPGMEAVAEMPAKDAEATATTTTAPAATTSPWLILAGLAAAGFVAYRYLGKRRAPGAA